MLVKLKRRKFANFAVFIFGQKLYAKMLKNKISKK